VSDEIRRLADAVLYEGHVLWPYRRSSVKNRQRWTFGGVYPSDYAAAHADRSTVVVECLLEGAAPQIEVEVRFLQAVHRQAAAGVGLAPVDEVGGFLTWDETVERTVRLEGTATAPIVVAGGRDVEPVDGGALVRTWKALAGRVEVDVDPEPGVPGLRRVRVEIHNESRWPGTERDGAVRRTFLSAHALIRVRGGRLVSAIDPPEALRELTDDLCHDGLWPVLVGEEGDRHAMLAAPIILADYARVAPESPGDFFDGGEIDQLLVLNILGLSDAEKRELRAGDPRARELLERTEGMAPDALMRLNGAIREFRPLEQG